MESYYRRRLHYKNKPLSSLSSDSSESSVSSLIVSMCPLSINANDYLSTYDNQHGPRLQSGVSELTIKSDSVQFNSSNRPSSQGLKRSHSFTIEKSSIKDDKSFTDTQSIVSTQSKTKKKLRSASFRRLLFSKKQRKSLTDSCLYLLLLRPELSIDTNIIETKVCPPSLPSPPPPPPSTSSVPMSSLQLSSERFNRFKQRQVELDRSMDIHIESVRTRAKENIKEIRKYWSYIKQVTLAKYQPKSFQLFDYLLPSIYFNTQFEDYFEDHDELKAAIEILSTTLNIVHGKHSYSTINQLYDNEEKLMIENITDQFESLLSSYTDELSFIRACTNFYETDVHEEKKFNWIQIIQIDYPCLREKISNDFVMKMPQIEQTLIQMLRNLKKQLLSSHIEINKK